MAAADDALRHASTKWRLLDSGTDMSYKVITLGGRGHAVVYHEWMKPLVIRLFGPRSDAAPMSWREHTDCFNKCVEHPDILDGTTWIFLWLLMYTPLLGSGAMKTINVARIRLALASGNADFLAGATVGDEASRAAFLIDHCHPEAGRTSRHGKISKAARE